MKQPTQEQIKEFWEWCGWRELVSGGVASPEQMVSGERYIPHDKFPPIDLNNLFKYAVPKLFNEDKIGVTIYLWDNSVTVKISDITIQDEDPALALFWALWQVKSK